MACMFKNGLSAAEADKETISNEYRTYDGIAFGCTSVAYGQVMYALRGYPGFKDLKYTNGEPVRWKLMTDSTSENNETQRFLGWITANCQPHKDGRKYNDFLIRMPKIFCVVLLDLMFTRAMIIVL